MSKTCTDNLEFEAISPLYKFQYNNEKTEFDIKYPDKYMCGQIVQNV